MAPKDSSSFTCRGAMGIAGGCRGAMGIAAGPGAWRKAHKGLRPARMPVYGAEEKRLDLAEKETEWLRFYASQSPGNSHRAPATVSNSQELAPFFAQLCRREEAVAS